MKPQSSPVGKFRWLALGSVAIALSPVSPVSAREPALSFELASQPPLSQPKAHLDNTADQSVVAKPLLVPSLADPTLLHTSAPDSAELPPPPHTPHTIATTLPESAIASQSPPKPLELKFELSQTTAANNRPTLPPPETVLVSPDGALDALFVGDSDSLVARAVGSAEGTRTPEGHRTPAYYGHVDPGNGVWNLGSFSYQHGARSPEEADRKQLSRLQHQASLLQAKAIAAGLELSLEEKLNGIDLANQAPRAALDRAGYIDWLHQAHAMGLRGSEAVLWARIRSFLDPDSQQWNAPGLGNDVQRISSDQERRLQAIARAMEVFQQQAPLPLPVKQRSPVESTAIDQILNIDLGSWVWTK